MKKTSLVKVLHMSIFVLLVAGVPTPSPLVAKRAISSAPNVVTAARLTITKGAFNRATVSVQKNGTLTLKNTDNVVYRIKVGATVVVIGAKGSQTIPLPQRGTFSITCTKTSSLRAILTVQ